MTTTPLSSFKLYKMPLDRLSRCHKILISTINAHSYNIAREDNSFKKALKKSNILLPDGISIVHAIRWLTGNKLNKIAGNDLFIWEMERMNKTAGKVFFLGSSEKTLSLIRERASLEYPNIQIRTYSPPYKTTFTDQENQAMTEAVNNFSPDVLFIGMTAPKQEKWAITHFHNLNTLHICCIGAVFDFYAGTVKRAPEWMINVGFEWLFRLFKEPRRMWRRYLIGNTKFSYSVIREYIAK